MVTKEEALEMLNNWAFFKSDSKKSNFEFPINDEIVYREQKDNEIIQYSFKYLIKIAYGI